MTIYQDCSIHLDSSKNKAARRQGFFFPIYLYRKLKKKSCQKPLARFPYNFIEMFLWLSSTKIVQAIWIRQKKWPPRAWGSLFSVYIYMENLKNLLVRNHWIDFIIYFAKNMVPGEAGLFSLYIYIENLKKSYCQEQLDRFHYNFAEMFLWWSSTKIVQAIWICQKNMVTRGLGLIFLIYLYRKLKKSSCQKPLNRFPYNFAEMFLWWSSIKIVQAIWICQKHGRKGAGLIFPIYL